MEYLSIIMSPVLVFNSENIYQSIVAPIKGQNAKKTVFEEDLPGSDVISYFWKYKAFLSKLTVRISSSAEEEATE
jgi:hypothetical protein